MTSLTSLALALSLASVLVSPSPFAAVEPVPAAAEPAPAAAGPAPTPPPLAHIGEEVCLAAEVDGAEGRVCARRVRFGASWDLELTDTLDDDRSVKASIALTPRVVAM